MEGFEGAGEVSPVALILPLVFVFGIAFLMVASWWKIFTKAGKPGWASLVPLYNIVVMVEVAGKPIWYVALFFIPLANIIAPILIGMGVAEKFGKSQGFGIGLGLIPFVFYPMLAFSDAEYRA
jgi:hypothetical protein